MVSGGLLALWVVVFWFVGSVCWLCGWLFVCFCLVSINDQGDVLRSSHISCDLPAVVLSQWNGHLLAC